MMLRLLPLAACLALACSNDKDVGTSALTTLFPDTDPTEAYGADETTASTVPSTDGQDATGDPPATDTGEPTTAASGADVTGEATTEATTNITTDATTDVATGEATTEPPPTEGPGVLPGETGLDAFCRRYVECGGTYYADAQQCIDESLAYWGECASRRDALDAFGACMSEIECADYDPDSFNPASTPCAQAWDDLNASEPC